jgi:hypothetical protein
MDILKELQKQANGVLKDQKKKEKMGDAVEGVLKEVKKSVKDENTKKMLDKAIKTVDDATTSKKKKKSTDKKEEDTKKKKK